MPDFDDELDRFARSYLTRAAQALDAAVPCTPCAAEDYLQDLQWNLLRRKPQFDPVRARWTTFVKLVTDHRSLELRHRCLRGRCRTAKIPLIHSDRDWPTEPSRSMAVDHDSLRIDLTEWMATLGPDEQKLCRLLMQNSVAETARRLGQPRSTTNEAIARLRRRFERTSLREYAPHQKLRRHAPRDDR